MDRPPLVDDLLARCAFPPPGTSVVCGVSGGRDSLAMLVLARASGLAVTAVHVDHGLRAGSAAEADIVAAAALRFGARLESVRVRVAPGPNLEARARAARRAALPPGALTGHTADDQAETVLLNLVRGAGLDGLAGIASGPTKPILALRRSETEQLCLELDLDPIDDHSNRERRYRRNRIRHEVLPLLDDVAQRDVAAVVARQAALLGDDAALLEALAAGIDPTDARAVAAAPAPLARRALREWLRPVSGPELHPPSMAAVERVLAVARGEVRAAEVGCGWRVARSRGRLRLEQG